MPRSPRRARIRRSLTGIRGTRRWSNPPPREPSHPSGQQVGHADLRPGRDHRGDILVGLQPFTVVVGPPIGGTRLGLALSIDLEHTLHEVHDPLLVHAGAGVEAALVPAIE